MSIEKNIEHFCSYFERQIELIGSRTNKTDGYHAPEDYQLPFYQKVLLVSALDTLTSIRYSREQHPSLSRKNRERFIRFVKDHANWSCGNLVSIPFLHDHLIKYQLDAGNLAKYLQDKLKQHNPKDGLILTIDKLDEQPESLLPLAKTEKEEEAILFYQHYDLLYRYRNFLVHESRMPGYGMEGIQDGGSEGYYHGYANVTKWHLAYPLELFSRLLSSSIISLRSYLIKQQIDPYSFVGDTTRW